MKKQFITEATRLQKLAGIITESQERDLNENQVSSTQYAIRVLNNFKRSRPFDTPTILRKLNALKDNIERQYDTEEIGNEMVYLELEDLEDTLNNGADITAAIDNTVSNLEGTENNGEGNIAGSTNYNETSNENALGILWRRATPEDDYDEDTEFIWIEPNMRKILTSFYKSLGSNNYEGIREEIEGIMYETGPSDWGSEVDMTVGEFLQRIKETYEEFGFGGES